MNEVNTLQAALQTPLEPVVPDWDAFKRGAGLQYGPGEAQTEEADRAWFAWQVFRGEHRANSCLPDGEGRVLGLIIKDTGMKTLKLPALPALQYLCICNNKELARLEFGGDYPALQHIDLEENGLQELDLRMEAAALSEMAENTKGDPGFRVPKVDWERTSRDVLATEWIDGTPIADVESLRAQGFDLVALGDTVIQS